MTMDDEHILREQQPTELFIPALDETLVLSERQKMFLRLAIRDIPADTVDMDLYICERVRAVQRRAYQIYPYRCIRGFFYVALRMSDHDVFAHVLNAGKTADPPILLDIGCCMGTDLRHLVRSGYHPLSVIGCDLRQAFIDLGYELYADRDSCPIPFIAGDVFDIVPSPFPPQENEAGLSLRDTRHLDDLRGRVKYVYAGSLFHLFDGGTQEAIARRLATLLDVTPGSGPAIVFGRHSGKVTEGVVDDVMGRIRYVHSPTSWERMWRRVIGEAARVLVNAVLRPGSTGTDDAQPMWWSVWIGD